MKIKACIDKRKRITRLPKRLKNASCPIYEAENKKTKKEIKKTTPLKKKEKKSNIKGNSHLHLPHLTMCQTNSTCAFPITSPHPQERKSITPLPTKQGKENPRIILKDI